MPFGFFKKPSEAPVLSKERTALRKDFNTAGVLDSLDDMEVDKSSHSQVYDKIFADLQKRILKNQSQQSYVTFFPDTKKVFVTTTTFCDYDPKERLYQF